MKSDLLDRRVGYIYSRIREVPRGEGVRESEILEGHQVFDPDQLPDQ